MQELIQYLEQNVGLNPDKASEVVTHVSTYLNHKLPPQPYIKVNSIVNGAIPEYGFEEDMKG